MKYVISDIHGMYKQYVKMLKLINFSDDDELYIIGDVIDRGDGGVKILRSIMQHPNMHMLLGNHELMALEAIKASLINKPRYMSLWLNHNGGDVTYKNLINLPKWEYNKTVEFLENLPVSMEVEAGDRKFYLVHGFPADNVMDAVWNRPDCNTPRPFEDKTLIIGHTPVFYFHGNNDYDVNDYIFNLRAAKEHFKIEHADGFIGIDCGCCAGLPESRLACLRLDDMEEFYVS